LHPDLETIKAAKQTVSQWLDSMGLELKPDRWAVSQTAWLQNNYQTQQKSNTEALSSYLFRDRPQSGNTASSPH
jgi:hypothetical protein